MDQKEKQNGEYYSIDLVHIFKCLWKRAWLIVLAGIIGAAGGFSYATFKLTPLYSSAVMMYVNNSSISLGSTNFSISQADLTVSQSLIKTYGQILNNRTTLELVSAELEEKSGLKYSSGALSGMISSGASNGTEIMVVTVTCGDPYHAAEIANTIAEVLPRRISEIINGTSMEIIDSAIPRLGKVSPNVTRYTSLGLFAGLLASAGILALIAFLDDTIYDEEYILRTYDYAVLAKVPNLLEESEGRYSYKSKYVYRSKNR